MNKLKKLHKHILQDVGAWFWQAFYFQNSGTPYNDAVLMFDKSGKNHS